MRKIDFIFYSLIGFWQENKDLVYMGLIFISGVVIIYCLTQVNW